MVAALRAMGVPVCFGAPRARRGTARDRRRARRSARGRRSRADAAHDRKTRRRRVRSGSDLHAQAARRLRRQRSSRRLSLGRIERRRDGLYVVGGLLAHAPATTAICNPTVNSYKRLVAAWDAPIYAVWSERSANALVRVPPGQKPARIEMRSPDPACNPYLALAVLIGAAADGVDAPYVAGSGARRIDLRASRKGTPRAGHPHAAEIAAPSDCRARRRPGCAGRARRSSLPCVPRCKLEEYERYRRAVHPWERDQYLRLY